ncbi:MAG: hypothetical protein NT051_06160 [Candidatus Micrarchaeota archaeon]|nr:hypothetical protein [Candidatus Micrarchaeota archaeon]
MVEELNYKRLRDLAREEKTQPGLVKIDSDFYSSVEKFLTENFSKMEESASVLQMREFENATAIIREISILRQQKILFRALRGRGKKDQPEDMTREEYGIYDRFCGIIDEEGGRLDKMLSRFERSGKRGEKQAQAGAQAPKQAEAPSQEPNIIKKVRFLKDVQAYVGANMETFGPYRVGDEGALPPEEAELLLKQRMAEKVE